jgi:putative ABC transport system ATP-binding protein/lipoprotein-releasing system ATP-binding protein
VAQIEIDNVEKTYRVGSLEIKAVDNISLKVEKGEFLSIVGHSGSGKTTLISMIGGIIQPTAGKIFFQDTDICALDDVQLSRYRSEKIGFMFQFASLLPMLTSKENVMLPILFNPSACSNHKRAEEYLDLVGLGDRINVYPAQLSGGQQRRVAIARALINEPEVILADEPTGDLDEETESDVMELFKKINKERKVTFIFITHNLGLAKQAERNLTITQGKLAES